MKHFKMAIHLLRHNIQSIILFEALYKLFAFIIFSPALYKLLNVALRLDGVPYLTNENMHSFFLNPSTDLVMLLIFLLMAFYTLIDMSAMVFCFQESYYGRKTHVWDMLRNGIRSAGKIFRLRTNWLMMVFLLLVIPMTNITLISGYISNIHLPEFVMEYISHRTWLIIVYSTGMIALCYLCVKWLFSIHYYTLEDCSFLEARLRSKALIKKRKWKDLLILVIWNAVITGVFYGILLLGSPIISLITDLCSHSQLVYAVSLSMVTDLFRVIAVLYYCFSVPIIFSIISALYYKNKEEKEEPIVDWMPKTELSFRIPVLNKLIGHKKILTVLILAVLIAGNLGNCLAVAKGKAISGLETSVEITAHRGDAAHYPENTMPAFESAAKMGVDFEELDVQQTRDGVVVVMHDSNLKRITGVKKNIWTVDYDEIRDLDAGSWFDKKFKDVRIPTLDEVIKEMKGKVKLHIEIKPTGHEPNIEQTVVQIIEQNDFVDQCVVTSRSSESLNKIKNYNPKIRTAYVAVTAYGHIEKADADVIYVEETFINSSMVDRVHNANKEMDAWVVNSEENMEKMLDLKVDNIITDDPKLLMNIIKSRDQKGYLYYYFNNLYSYFSSSVFSQ